GPAAPPGSVPGPPSKAAPGWVAVRIGDKLSGAITLKKPKNEPVAAAEDKLLEHLASQAGLVLRNVRLTAELQARIDDLRASRRRLVQAQDTERHRIERNLPHGAPQQPVPLNLHLTLLGGAPAGPPEVPPLPR